MYHRISRFILVAFAFLSLVACKKKPAQIAFPQTNIELGTLFTNDASHSLEVEFQNQGDEDLVIKYVFPSCDCVTVEHVDSVVAGGKKGAITVNYDFSPYSPRQINRSIVIYSNSADTICHYVNFHALLKHADN